MTDALAIPHTTSNDRAPFDRTAPFRSVLDLGKAPPSTLDGVHAAARALGIARQVAPHCDAIAMLPGLDLQHLHNLADSDIGLGTRSL